MKSNKLLSRNYLLKGSLFLSFGFQIVSAQSDFYYTDAGSNKRMTTTDNWSTAPDEIIAPAAEPGAADNLFFNIDGVDSTTPHLAAGNRAYNSLTFRSSGTTQIDRAGFTSGDDSTLTLGSGGILVEEGAELVRFGRSEQRVLMRASSDLTITHNSEQNLVFNQNWGSNTSEENTLTTITVAGSGSGSVNFARIVDSSGGRRVGVTIDRDADTGFVNISGNNNYTGPTQVNSGTLRIDAGGRLEGTDVTVANGGRIVNRGEIRDGDLTLGSGGILAINPNLTLNVNGSGTVSFDNFGILNLQFTTIDGWDEMELGTYTLIDGTAEFDYTGLLDVGESEAVEVGDIGRSAYFKEGSLQLVVIPEPSTIISVLIAGGAALLGLSRRRR